jgi:hypothetical protein
MSTARKHAGTDLTEIPLLVDAAISMAFSIQDRAEDGAGMDVCGRCSLGFNSHHASGRGESRNGAAKIHESIRKEK